MRDAALLAREQGGDAAHTTWPERRVISPYSLATFGLSPRPIRRRAGAGPGPDVLEPCPHWRQAWTGPTNQPFCRTRTGVAHCPCSNCRLASGIARCAACATQACRGLGVDGSASIDAGNLVAEVTDGDAVAAGWPGPAGPMSPRRRRLRIAHARRGRGAGRGAEIGQLVPGYAPRYRGWDVFGRRGAGKSGTPRPFCWPDPTRVRDLFVRGCAMWWPKWADHDAGPARGLRDQRVLHEALATR